MKKIGRIAVLVLAAAAVSCGAQARIIRNYKTESSEVLVFRVDSVDFRKTLTRVYGKISGRPHTSNRIDGVTMIIKGKKLVADDIDGVDFKRYFQWEDDGNIPIEIDFPATKPINNFNIDFQTVRGTATTIVKK